jgi:hypothetical protein
MEAGGFTEADQEKAWQDASDGATKRRMGLGFASAPTKPKPRKQTTAPIIKKSTDSSSIVPEAPKQTTDASVGSGAGCVIAGQRFDDKSSIWTYIKNMQQELEDGKVRLSLLF